VVCSQPRLALATACGSHDVPLVKDICFLIIAIIIVGRSRNPMRTLLAPHLAALGAPHGAMNIDVGWRQLATAWGHLPAAWGGKKLGHLIAGGIPGSDTTQLLSGAPKNVVRFLEEWWLLCVAHTASERVRPWPFGVMTVSLPIAVFALARVPRVAFGLCAHVPVASLTTILGLGALAPLPWRDQGH
jgi:hypothetical protein